METNKAKVIRGLDIIIMADTSEKQDGTKYEAVGGQRGATLNRSSDVIDVSNKVSSGWKEVLTSLKEWSIEADGIFLDGDSAIDLLEKAFEESKPVMIKIGKEDESWGHQGLAIITDFPIEAPYDDATTYSITLQGAGGLTKLKPKGEVKKEK